MFFFFFFFFFLLGGGGGGGGEWHWPFAGCFFGGGGEGVDREGAGLTVKTGYFWGVYKILGMFWRYDKNRG